MAASWPKSQKKIPISFSVYYPTQPLNQINRNLKKFKDGLRMGISLHMFIFISDKEMSVEKISLVFEMIVFNHHFTVREM